MSTLRQRARAAVKKCMRALPRSASNRELYECAAETFGDRIQIKDSATHAAVHNVIFKSTRGRDKRSTSARDRAERRNPRNRAR